MLAFGSDTVIRQSYQFTKVTSAPHYSLSSVSPGQQQELTSTTGANLSIRSFNLGSETQQQRETRSIVVMTSTAHSRITRFYYN